MSFYFLIAVTLVAFCSGPAYGHKVKLFAAVEGEWITGYAYYTSSARPKNVIISLLAPDGTIIEELTTDENGEFKTRARYRTDTLIKLDSADGHSASWLISADEFNPALPEYLEESTAKQEKSELAEVKHSAFHAAEKTGKLQSAQSTEIASIVRDELLPLTKQLSQLRAQLDQQQERKRFQDILGGVGYLVGLAGIASYMAARRKERK